MKTKLAVSAVAVAIAMLSQASFAQSTAPVTRADVKADAKSGSLAPAGQGPGAMAGSAATTGKSDKTRVERKDDTKMAKDAGTLKPAGEAADRDDKGEKVKGTNTTRADRKATTKAAVQSGETKPAGEAPLPLAVPPKK